MISRPKSESIFIPSLFRHYKGGKYRMLMMAVATDVPMRRNDTPLFSGHHSDHSIERPMPMYVFTSGDGAVKMYVDSQKHRHRLHVIYVSVGSLVDGRELPGYGSIWGRDNDEFFGKAEQEVDGKIVEVPRFSPIASTRES